MQGIQPFRPQFFPNRPLYITTQNKKVEKDKKDIHNQWLYTTRRGLALSYIFSLEFPYALGTLSIWALLFISFSLVFTLTDSAQAILSIGFIAYSWFWFIWIYQLFLLITVSYRKLDMSLLTVGLFMYIATILQNGILYSLTRYMHETSFIGMDGDFSRISIIGLSLYLAVETDAGLGTGAIFANFREPYGFPGIAINSLQGIILLQFIIATLVIVVDDSIAERTNIEKSPRMKQYFYKTYNRWLYTTQEGNALSHVFSLEYPYFFTSVPLACLFLVVYFFVFIFTENTAAIIALSIIAYAWIALVWIYQMYIFSTISYLKLDVTIMSIPAWLYFLSIFQNATAYSAIRHSISDAFIGMMGDFSNLSIYGLSWFLSIETITGLGTGAIFSNPVFFLQYLVVCLNSIQFIVILSVFLSVLLVIFTSAVESRYALQHPSLLSYLRNKRRITA